MNRADANFLINFISFAIGILSCSANGYAEPPASAPVELKATLGFSTFIDNNFIEHIVAGASVRVPFARRWSLEPEVLYMRADDTDDDFLLLTHCRYEVLTSGRVRPYVAFGGGVIRQRDKKLGPGRNLTSVSHQWTVQGGLGARLFLTEHWILTPEARLGLEPFFQVTASIGYAF